MNAKIHADDVLESHRWNHRLLLVFSPRADDLRVRDFDEQLAEHACELAERDLVVGHLPAFGGARLGNKTLAPESATKIRREFGVGLGEFAVVLVGKDGFAKRRVAEAPDLNALFKLIDGMPMRREEMRARGVGCS